MCSFVVCGVGVLSRWSIKGQQLICRKQLYPEANILCIDYIRHMLGMVNEIDVILGTDQGFLSTFVNNSYFDRKRAHDGPITCLKISLNRQRSNDLVNIIISAGLDGYIKLWNSAFELLKSISTKDF